MASPESPLAAHPPAMKVGGRRLSITSRHKHQSSPSVRNSDLIDIWTDDYLASEQPLTTPAAPAQSVAADYPRPAAPGAGNEAEAEHHEEEVPKKDNKKQHHGPHDNERVKESAHWKVEANRPTRDTLGGKKDFGAGGRISQPAGRGLA